MWRQTQVDSCPGPDSHDQRVARVRRAMHREARDRVVHAATEFLIMARGSRRRNPERGASFAVVCVQCPVDVGSSSE